jgi:hemerythrin-like domain-containing protein
MKPSQILSEEHKDILFMLEILKNKSIALQSGNLKILDDLIKLIHFLKFYADKFHHGKEEDLLFPKYEAAGVPGEQGPIGVMLQEHVLGRGYIFEMTKAIEEIKIDGKTNRFVENAQKYYTLLTEHIFKEDNILYPMGDQKLSRDVEMELSQKFDLFENQKFELIPELKEALETLNFYKNK